jgi:hypothetical protein
VIDERAGQRTAANTERLGREARGARSLRSTPTHRLEPPAELHARRFAAGEIDTVGYFERQSAFAPEPS